MALRHSTLRASASLAIALVLLATASADALAAPRKSAHAGATTSGSTPAAPGKRLANAPKFTTPKAGTRPSVNMRRLAAKKPTVREHRTLPFLTRDASKGGTPSGGPKTVLAVPPAPIEATTNVGSPTAFKSSFDGLAQSTSAATNGEPPDPWVAVGPEHIVQAVNLQIRITDRQGANALDTALPDFFQLPPPSSIPTFDSDPHVIYDSLHGRWLATEVSWDCETYGTALYGHGYIDFAVSRTSDPTGTWDLGFIGWDDALPDYPAPGTTTDKIGIGSNLFNMAAGADCLGAATFDGGDVVFLDWADVLDLGTLTPREAFFPGTDNSSPPAVKHWFTPRVALQVPATSARMHIVIQNDFGTGTTGLGHVTVVGSAKTGSLTFERLDNLTDEFPLVSGFVDPIPPRQPGSPATIVKAVDSRPTDALWQGDRLVLVSTAGCTPATDTALRDCVRVTELDTSTVGTAPSATATLRQDFLVTEIGRDIFMGGIGLSGDGTLHVGYTRSSGVATDYPVARTRHQSPGDAINTVSQEQNLAGGAGTYPGTRWGDYVGVAQDPQVPSQVWDGNEGSIGAAGWVTKISRLQTGGTTYVPIAPVRVLDTRPGGIGALGMFTSGNARSWQVAGILGIPLEAVAVTGNVTVAGQGSGGFVSVTVTSNNNPSTSTINFPVGETRANNVTTALSPAGKLSATFKGGAGKKTHLLFDVTGYFLADNTGATFTKVTPYRALDTRGAGTGLAGKFTANTARTLQITNALGPVPLTATAITGNLTLVGPSKAGFASVTKTFTNAPATSTINFPAGSTRANGVFAPLDTTGELSIVYRTSGGGTTHILLDVTGYFEPGVGGLKFVPLNPSRIMDSRPTAVMSGVSGVFATGVPKTLTVQGHWGVPSTAVAVTGNLTVASQTGAGFVSATPTFDPAPTTSTINFPVGDTMANGIVAPLSGSDSSFVYKTTLPGKTTHLILDLSGYFE